MKRTWILLLMLCLSGGLTAQNIRFALQPMLYGTADGEMYWDIYSTLDASTLSYELGADSSWNAALKVVVQLGDKIDVFQFEYSANDSASGAPLLMEKSSFAAPERGFHPLKIVLMDQVSKMEWTLEDTLEVPQQDFMVAAPMLLEDLESTPDHFLKGSVPVVPLANLGIPVLDAKDKISWYSEALVQSGKYLLRYYVEDANGTLVEGSSGFKRCKQGANPVLMELDFSAQSSGTYAVVLSGLDSLGQEVLERRTDFLWYNSKVDTALFDRSGDRISKVAFESQWGNWSQVQEYIRMIAPITSLSQRRVLGNLKDIEDTALAAQFIVGFWQSTAPEAPVQTWKAYLKIVEKVDSEFGSKTMPGYKTQMGRVFLQYGAPSLVEERPFDGKNYPYQIWQYDQLKSTSTPVQQNQVFIFVDQELVGRQYTLIHSSALGEVKDHKWQYHLSRHTNAGPDIDATSTQMGRDNFGERISNSLIIGNQGTWFDRFNN